VGSAADTEACHIICFSAMLLALLSDVSFPALLYELFFTGCPLPAVPYPLSFANLILAGVFG
jgi:hypothetical protein